MSPLFQPGCKFETRLWGRGAGRQWRPQNAVSILKHRPSRQARPGKSTFFRLLAVKDEWFSDDLRRLDDDNVYRKLQGHWIIEMSEMIATANAKSIEDIKSFLSKQKETYKVPYETHPADRLRQCVFAGTTNRQDFLPRDRTGNRRFIPVPVDAELVEVHISISKTMQRANKDALEKLDPNQVYHTFPDRREGSKSSLILKKPKTKKSTRILYMTKPLKEELLAWLEKLKQDEQSTPEKYSNCGQLFRLPDGLPIAPELLTKWYRLWRAEHPEFEQIVFHGLRHSSATYQLLQSDGDFKSVQGNTGHATASVLMDTYAHTQDKPRLELTEKIEANFYSQDLTPATPQPQQNEKPAATKISGKEILEAIRLMDADERRELTRALFA